MYVLAIVDLYHYLTGTAEENICEATGRRIVCHYNGDARDLPHSFGGGRLETVSLSGRPRPGLVNHDQPHLPTEKL